MPLPDAVVHKHRSTRQFANGRRHKTIIGYSTRTVALSDALSASFIWNWPHSDVASIVIRYTEDSKPKPTDHLIAGQLMTDDSFDSLQPRIPI